MPVAIESASARETFGAGEEVMGRFATKRLSVALRPLRLELVLLLCVRAPPRLDPELRRPKLGAVGKATLTRLELARAEPSRFLVCPLNHSGTVSSGFIMG